MAWTFNSSSLIKISFLTKTLYKPVLNLLCSYYTFFLSNIYCSPYVNICKYKSQAPIFCMVFISDLFIKKVTVYCLHYVYRCYTYVINIYRILQFCQEKVYKEGK